MNAAPLDDVIYKIKCIVTALCKDANLRQIWLEELEWFDVFNEEISMSNCTENNIIEWCKTKRVKIRQIINRCIIKKENMSDWEHRIVNIYEGTDDGCDLPCIADVIYNDYCEDDNQYNYDEEDDDEDQYYYYDEEDEKEERRRCRAEDIWDRLEDKYDR